MDYLVFNELSYPFKDRYEAHIGIQNFIRTFAAASTMGLSQLRLHRSIGDQLYNLELAPGYFMFHWLKSEDNPGTGIPGDGLMKVELQERFKEIMTSSPLVTDDEPLAKEISERSTFEMKLANGELKEAYGLGAAYLLDTIALSFLSTGIWDTDRIESLTHYILQEDGSDAVEVVTILHANRPGHMDKHAPWVEKKKLDSLKSSKNLWERREEFFPNLVLCGLVEEQLTKGFGIKSKYFEQIKDKLKMLDTFAKSWTKGGYSNAMVRRYGLNVSGESERTMQKYGRERRFRLPDGSRAYFEKHIKSGDLRFHFFPDENKHTVFVGYIGYHLPTVTG